MKKAIVCALAALALVAAAQPLEDGESPAGAEKGDDCRRARRDV